MGRRTMAAAAALATAAVAIPATVVLAGSSELVSGDVGRESVIWTTDSHNAPKDWKQVPELGFLGSQEEAHAINVSAEMTKGNAKFRVISQGSVVPPGSITFTGKAANSFTFGYADGCYTHPVNQLEWKRVGKGKATARTISVLDLNGGQFCL